MKIVLIICALILLISSGLLIYITQFTPALPPGTRKIIERAVSEGPGELVQGVTGVALSGDIEIWYEVISPTATKKGTVLLIMGIANDALAWPDFFVRPLLDDGYEVIRYDQRGTGMSDWVENWDKDNPYSLEDMANDAAAILDHMGVTETHVVGVSMGGMVAQTFAILHPQKTLSLTSIMSSGFIMDPDLPGIPQNLVADLLALNIKYGLVQNEPNMIKMHVAIRKLLKGRNLSPSVIDHIANYVLYNMRFRKGYNTKAPRQHIAAIYVSGSRCDKLQKLNVPTLIVHGKSDPFIPLEHGKKCAELIPNSTQLWIDNMGHDLPENSIDTLISGILTNFETARQIAGNLK